MDSFENLFVGNTRFFGVHENNTSSTKKEKLNTVRYSEHLKGIVSLGICPIKDNNKVSFAAIDIDNHGKYIQEPDDIKRILKEVWLKYKGSLIPCRSKSGGLHLYRFYKFEIPAFYAINEMKTIAKELNVEFSEIFPKQRFITPGNYGNWINLPYFGATRQALDENGNEIEFFQFIEIVNQHRVEVSTIISIFDFMSQAPPCIAKALEENLIGKGNRNIWLFHIAVFIKQTGMDLNLALNEINNIIASPLSEKEISTIIKSVQNKDYKYKCREPEIQEVCKSCNLAEICRTRKFGVSEDDFEEMESSVFAEFLSAVYWLNEMKQVENITLTYQLSDRESEERLNISPLNFIKFPEIKKMIYLSSYVLIQEVKQKKWETQINKLPKTFEDLPDQLNPGYKVIEMVIQWLEALGTTKKIENVALGKVYTDIFKGIEYYYFEPGLFSERLKNLIGANKITSGFFAELSAKYGFIRQRLYIGEKRPTLWAFPVNVIEGLKSDMIKHMGIRKQVEESEDY